MVFDFEGTNEYQNRRYNNICYIKFGPDADELEYIKIYKENYKTGCSGIFLE